MGKGVKIKMRREFASLRDLYDAVGDDNPFWVESGQYKAQFTRLRGEDKLLVLLSFMHTLSVPEEYVAVKAIRCLDTPLHWTVSYRPKSVNQMEENEA